MYLGICPKAFNPTGLELLPNRRSIRVSTNVNGGIMNGRFQLGFGLSTAYFAANANEFSSAQCKAAVESMKGVDSASCVQYDVNANSGIGSYLITFLSYPRRAFENNLFTHNGNPSLKAFSCNTTFVDKEDARNPSCNIEDVETENLPCMLSFWCIWAICICCSVQSVSRLFCFFIIVFFFFSVRGVQQPWSMRLSQGPMCLRKRLHGDACDDTRDAEVRFV